MDDYKFKFEDNCWFKGNCTKEKSEGCSSLCSRYMEMHYLINTSNIPKKLRGINKLKPIPEDMETFKQLNKIKIDINNFVNNGDNLYLWGSSCGSGKTTWAVKLMQAFMASIHHGNQFRDRCMFCYVPTLLVNMKNFADDDRFSILEKLSTVDLVVIDDIGSVATSNFDLTNLASLIDRRYSNNLSTIYTSNLSPDELETKVDVRISDRVLAGYSMQITSNSFRGKGSVYQ